MVFEKLAERSLFLFIFVLFKMQIQIQNKFDNKR